MTTPLSKANPSIFHRTWRVTAAADAATVAVDLDRTDEYDITALAQALTFSIPTGSLGIENGCKHIIRIKDNGTARALTWTGGAGGYASTTTNVLPVITTTGKTLFLGFWYDSTSGKHVLLAGPSYE